MQYLAKLKYEHQSQFVFRTSANTITIMDSQKEVTLMTKVLHLVQSDFISSLRDSLSISLKWGDSVCGNTSEWRVGAQQIGLMEG